MITILLDFVSICATTSVGFVCGYYFNRWRNKRGF